MSFYCYISKPIYQLLLF